MDQRTHPVRAYWVVFFLAFVASCATQEEFRKAGEEGSLENLVEVQPAIPATSVRQKEQAPLLELTLPQLDLAPKKPPAPGPRFSLSAENVDVKSILFSLSKEIDQNIVIDPAIEKKVTLHLSNVTLGEMLDHVLTPLNLRFKIDGDFIQVTELEMQTRVFHLNYLISRRESTGNLQVPAGSSFGALADSGNSLSRISATEETDLWQEISFGLRQMIGVQALQENALAQENENNSARNGFVSINKQAGVIVVKTFPEELLRVAKYLEEVEGSVQRQVFIQARIIQVALRDEFKSGIDWTQVNAFNSGSEKNDSLQDERRQTQRVLSEEAQLEEMLAKLSLQGDVSVIASPRITALNNQRAVIRVGTEDTRFTLPVNSAGGERTAEYTAQAVDFGIVLDVVPQINVNGDVIMNVFTRVRRKAGDRSSPDGQYQVPIVAVQESNNVVLARSGQTVVVGGMRKTHKRPQPVLLERAPVIGSLFQHGISGYEKSELVILLTPEIMVGEAIEDRWRIEEKRLQQFGFNRHTQKTITSSEKR